MLSNKWFGNSKWNGASEVAKWMLRHTRRRYPYDKSRDILAFSIRFHCIIYMFQYSLTYYKNNTTWWNTSTHTHTLEMGESERAKGKGCKIVRFDKRLAMYWRWSFIAFMCQMTKNVQFGYDAISDLATLMWVRFKFSQSQNIDDDAHQRHTNDKPNQRAHAMKWGRNEKFSTRKSRGETNKKYGIPSKSKLVSTDRFMRLGFSAQSLNHSSTQITHTWFVVNVSMTGYFQRKFMQISFSNCDFQYCLIRNRCKARRGEKKSVSMHGWPGMRCLVSVGSVFLLLFFFVCCFVVYT